MTALKLDKDNINIIHHLANVAEKLNKTEFAIENYNKYIPIMKSITFKLKSCPILPRPRISIR
jgi:hypothetical protein